MNTNRKDDLEKFNYMMLGRLQSDCDYYLGFGNRHEKHLWAGSVDGQIKEMKRLWNSFPKDKKPEWLTMEQILKYEKEMKENKPTYRDGGITGDVHDLVNDYQSEHIERMLSLINDTFPYRNYFVDKSDNTLKVYFDNSSMTMDDAAMMIDKIQRKYPVPEWSFETQKDDTWMLKLTLEETVVFAKGGEVGKKYYAIYDENTYGLIYHNDEGKKKFMIIHASGLKKSPFNILSGSIDIDKSNEHLVRKATIKDYEDFNIYIPKDFEQLNGNMLGNVYKIFYKVKYSDDFIGSDIHESQIFGENEDEARTNFEKKYPNKIITSIVKSFEDGGSLDLSREVNETIDNVLRNMKDWELNNKLETLRKEIAAGNGDSNTNNVAIKIMEEINRRQGESLKNILNNNMQEQPYKHFTESLVGKELVDLYGLDVVKGWFNKGYDDKKENRPINSVAKNNSVEGLSYAAGYYYVESRPKEYAKGGQIKKGDILESTTGVKVKVVEFDPKSGGKVRVLRLDEFSDGKPSGFMPLKKFKVIEESLLSNGKPNYEKGDEGMYDGAEVRVLKFDGSKYQIAELDEDGTISLEPLKNIDKHNFESSFRMFPKMGKGGVVDFDYSIWDKDCKRYELYKEDDDTYYFSSYKVPFGKALIIKKDELKEKIKNGEFTEKSPFPKMAKGGMATKYVPISKEDIDEFVDYVDKFYGKEGIYAEDLKGGFTKKEIREAINKYLQDLAKTATWGHGDSLDRERVRQYLDANYKLLAKGGEVGGRGFFGLNKGKKITSSNNVKKGDILLAHSKQFNSNNTIKIIGIRKYGKTTSLDAVYWNPSTNKRIGKEEFSISDYDLKTAEYFLPESGTSNFKKKVNAISKKLVYKKVPTKYKKVYGKTYDKQEAKVAATKIAGSIVQKAKKFLAKKTK